MSIYFDTSALAKLVVDEAETEALRSWIGLRRDSSRVTNVVGVVELQRLAARIGQAEFGVAVQLLARIDQLDLTPTAVAAAARIPPPAVRTLDALHIASASELADLEAMLTYDVRMISAAQDYGLQVMSAGFGVDKYE